MKSELSDLIATHVNNYSKYLLDMRTHVTITSEQLLAWDRIEWMSPVNAVTSIWFP